MIGRLPLREIGRPDPHRPRSTQPASKPSDRISSANCLERSLKTLNHWSVDRRLSTAAQVSTG